MNVRCVAGAVMVMAGLSGSARAEVLEVSTLYTAAINPLNGVHPLWTPVQHARGRTFVVVPDLKLRPMVTQIARDGAVTAVPLDPNPDYTASPDGHNRFTMGIDRTGYIHIIGDMHGYAPWAGTYVKRYQYQNMLYWRSNKPLDVTGGFTYAGGLASATAFPGVEWGGDSRFFYDRNGELYFSSRVRAFQGAPLKYSEPFIAYGVYRYSTTNGLWTALGGSAAAAAPGATNYNTVLYWEYTSAFEAYQTQPRFDGSNRLHFSIAGNTAGTEGQGLVYAVSDDCGATWKKANGKVIPGLPLRGKDGEANQADLVIRSKSVAQQSSVQIDKGGTINVAGWTWSGTNWVPIAGGCGLLGPDTMLTAERGSALGRSTAMGQPMIEYDTGFGQVFSLCELALQNENAIYGIGLPKGCNFVNATNMAVFRATFKPGENAAAGANRLPLAPTLFKPVADNAQVWLSWTASAYATGYNVKRSKSRSGPYTAVAKGVTCTGEHLDAGLVNGTIYYYVVSAMGSLGESPDSAPVSVKPTLPAPLAPVVLTAVGRNGRVVLNWLPLWPEATSYTVKRATVRGGPYTTVAKGVTGLGYTDTGLVNDIPYSFVVSAVNKVSGESPDSNQVIGTPFRWIPILQYESVGYDPAVQGVASASGENPPHETAAKAFDGVLNSKWLVLANTGWLQYRFTNGVAWAVTRYRMISGQDGPERDPTDWQFQGSVNGTGWATLDTRTNQVFSGRNMAQAYTFSNSTAYPYYRLNITRNIGNGITQLAELELWADDKVLRPGRD